MVSENPSGADNQQETARSSLVLDPNWLAGFVDGEGCFSVSVHRSSMMRRHGGWQLQPVFHVYQHQDHRDVLEAMVPTFGCGRIRSKGPGSSVLTFAVEALRDLDTAVVPFFEEHRLVVKAHDFLAFAVIVRSMRQKEHLTSLGFERLVRLAYGMNANGKQRAKDIDQVLAGSSETAREAPTSTDCPASTGERRSRLKIQSDPHGDMGSQAEMTWPLEKEAGVCLPPSESSNKSA